jgi:SAM-dependent methyltransferase
MTGLYETLDHCLLCRAKTLELVLPLAPIPIATPNFSVPERLRAESTKGVPLELYQCRGCGHLQVGQVGNPEFQYRDYVYTTSLSPGLTEHFERYSNEVWNRIKPSPQTLVVEIGSNDGTLLRFFRSLGMRTVGVDPARRIAEEATRSGIETIGDFFSERLAHDIRAKHGLATLVVANNMIANVHDLVDFAKGVEALLADDGAFVFETQYGVDVVERALLDTVYHEHLSYFRIRPLEKLFAPLGLHAIDVQRVPTKGGSIRVTVARVNGPRKVDDSVGAILAEEQHKRVYERSFFEILARQLASVTSELAKLVAEYKTGGRLVAGYGVSVGTTTLLPRFGLIDKIDFVVDDDPNKERTLEGPGYAIPVGRPQMLLEKNPAAVVVFAWRYADAIVKGNAAYLNAGGRFIIPLPDVRIIQGAGATAGTGS